MAGGIGSNPLLIKPREIEGGSRRWVDWISPVPNRGWQLAHGYVLSATAMLLGLGIIGLYGYFQNASVRHNPGAFFMGFLALLGVLVRSLFRFADRVRAPRVIEILKRDRRPPVLLLRSFSDDFHKLPGYSDRGGTLTFSQGGSKTFEEFLYETFSTLGPVIAIGRPGELTPPLGASRMWVTDAALERSRARTAGRGLVRRVGHGRSRPPPPARGSHAADAECQGGRAALGGSHAVRFDRSAQGDFGHATDRRREGLPCWRRYQVLSYGRLPPYEGGEIGAMFDAHGTCHVARIEKTGLFKKAFNRDVHAYQVMLQVRAG